MMNFLYRTQNPMLQALLTQRMLKYIAVTNTFPSPAVSTAYSRVPVVLLVAAVLYFLVFLAEPSFRQPGASGVRTGTLWFPWHPATSFGQKESPAGLLPRRPSHIFSCYKNTTPEGKHFTHYAFPNSRTVRCCRARFFLSHDPHFKWGFAFCPSRA